MGELPMKVLLVDDESYMTEYLKKLVDWKSYGRSTDGVGRLYCARSD